MSLGIWLICILNSRQNCEELRRSFYLREALNRSRGKRENQILRQLEIADFVAQVAHDIRAPLAALNVVIEDESALPDSSRELISLACRRIQECAETVLGKANYIRTEKSSSEQVYPIVNEIVSEKLAQVRGFPVIEVTGRVERQLPCCSVDAVLLKRIVSNLLDNAIQAPGTSKIGISFAHQEDKYVVIEIEDNGQGIPETVFPNLMKKGFTFNKKGGTGLGLYNAKTAIEKCGGRIELKSVQGKGTKVSLFLPTAD